MFHLFLGISLKRRLFITYLLLSSLILMLTSVFFYTASKKVLIKRAALSSQQQLSLITSNLGEKIDNISNYAITLSINSNIADVLKENPTVPENTLEHFLVNSELTDQAQRIIGLHKNIYAWDILDTENHWFHSSTTETDQLDSILGPEVLDSLQTNLAFQFLGPFQISGEPTFVALKSITNIDNTKYLGALVLLIRETNISSAFRDLPDSSSRDFYITDENGQILSSSSSGGIYKDFSSYTKISSENYKTLTETDRQFFSVDGTDTLFICKSYPDLNWNVINLIPLESLTLDHMVILHNILLISIVVFILSVFFSILCTGTVTAPIQKLVEKMKSASAGKLNISASYSSNDELAVLYNQFNLMMQKIQTLLNDIYEEQNAKQKMEVRLLQSQINPHFLYITLNTISFYVRSNPETARKLIKYLSDYFRHSLNNPSKFISLAEEMRVIDCYIQLERARFSDRLSVTYDFSEDMLENLQIPPLLLQPLVENAVIHGVIKREEGGTVRVGLIEHKTYNKIYVIDTGVGISRRKLKTLLIDRKRRDHIGLIIVHQRLVSIFGERCGLHILSKEGKGTIVFANVPKVEKTEGKDDEHGN